MMHRDYNHHSYCWAESTVWIPLSADRGHENDCDE